ncbi:hypothetical protein ACLKA6_010270 [Drosophila palustris]
MARGLDVSPEFRKLIIKLYLENRSLRAIGQYVNKPHSTVQGIIIKYTETGDLSTNHYQAGRPSKLTIREQRSLVVSVVKNPKITSTILSQNVQEGMQKQVCSQTIRNSLNNAGNHGRVARRKQFISKAYKKKWLELSKMHLGKPDPFWGNVIFSDESKFNIFGHVGPLKVCRKVNEAMTENNIILTV